MSDTPSTKQPTCPRTPERPVTLADDILNAPVRETIFVSRRARAVVHERRCALVRRLHDQLVCHESLPEDDAGREPNREPNREPGREPNREPHPRHSGDGACRATALRKRPRV